MTLPGIQLEPASIRSDFLFPLSRFFTLLTRRSFFTLPTRRSPVPKSHLARFDRCSDSAKTERFAIFFDRDPCAFELILSSTDRVPSARIVFTILTRRSKRTWLCFHVVFTLPTRRGPVAKSEIARIDEKSTFAKTKPFANVYP